MWADIIVSSTSSFSWLDLFLSLSQSTEHLSWLGLFKDLSVGTNKPSPFYHKRTLRKTRDECERVREKFLQMRYVQVRRRHHPAFVLPTRGRHRWLSPLPHAAAPWRFQKKWGSTWRPPSSTTGEWELERARLPAASSSSPPGTCDGKQTAGTAASSARTTRTVRAPLMRLWRERRPSAFSSDWQAHLNMNGPAEGS